MRVAIIGSQGIPAKYGGFETLVEYLAEYLASEFEITVYCSSIGSNRNLRYYKGVELKYIPLDAHGWQSVLFDMVSIFSAVLNFDKVLILGSSGTLSLLLFRKFRAKLILNLGGVEWQRSKWGFAAQKFLRLSESIGVKCSGVLVADNVGMQEYISEVYGRDSVMIPYGGDQVTRVSRTSSDLDKYPFLVGNYAFSVARIQRDNNIEVICEALCENSQIPLVLVGNWSASEFGERLREKFQDSSNLFLLDAIYDRSELDLLRSNCRVYIHGHSAGGTNPALVEAMHLNLPIVAFDNIFNRYTTENKAIYFNSSEALKLVMENIYSKDLDFVASQLFEIAKSKYTWAEIARQYSQVLNY